MGNKCGLNAGGLNAGEINTDRVLVITGPTATGKTRLGVLLAQQLSGEVVSADSMQVYKGMDIGSAKPTLQEMQGVAHHMLDVAEVYEDYSVARYVKDATECVEDILRRGKLPIIVGGTGFYIDSLILGRSFAHPPADEKLRARLSEQYDTVGGEAMLSMLAEIDRARAEKLHPADKKRIIRAIEVYRLTGMTMTWYDNESRNALPRFNASRIALNYKNREDLYSRINLRVDEMMEKGLLHEVKSLLDCGLSERATAMQAIGYKEIAGALRGDMTMDEAVGKIKQESRRYAKRQLTWLRRQSYVKWLLWDKKPDFTSGRLPSTCFLYDTE